MKRRFMMWMTIICILVVGGSITRVTRDFIVSQGLESADDVSVASTEHIEAARFVPIEESVAETFPEAFAEAEPIAAAETVIEEYPQESIVKISPIDVANNQAIQETVKSPLDPVAVKNPVIEAKEEQVFYQAKDFFERFAQAEQSALQVWENVSLDNRSAYLAAAEQERILWDHELSQLSQVICERLSKEEIEELKIQEMEWIKERDLYAEKAVVKSSMKNAQNQNPDYTRALTQKTKERCYWLVSEFEDVLNQD